MDFTKRLGVIQKRVFISLRVTISYNLNSRWEYVVKNFNEDICLGVYKKIEGCKTVCVVNDKIYFFGSLVFFIAKDFPIWQFISISLFELSQIYLCRTYFSINLHLTLRRSLLGCKSCFVSLNTLGNILGTINYYIHLQSA